MAFPTVVAPQPNRGTNFALVINEFAAHLGGDDPVTNNLEPSSYAILVTDDDDGFRRTLRGLLEQRGFRTLEASDGEEAIDLVRESDVHIALLDMYMPTLSGLETLRILKQLKAFLPCILLSADLTDRLIHEALSAKAFTVLAKPISHQLIVETIRQAIQQCYQAIDRSKGGWLQLRTFATIPACWEPTAELPVPVSAPWGQAYRSINPKRLRTENAQAHSSSGESHEMDRSRYGDGHHGCGFSGNDDAN